VVGESGAGPGRLKPALVTRDLTTELLGRCTFPPRGTAVTCGVSGGADSLALLVLAVAHGCSVTAVHVDHGLRPGSDGEGELVGATAERFGAAFRAERVRVPPGPNLESRAREARRAVLPPDALLGHTADDQAETMLLNLMRGAGLEGLGGMRPDRRPILGLRRSETRRLCAELGLDPVDDPSNRDPAFRRNRVRHEVLPLLADIAERDLVPVLVRQAQILRDAADEIDERSLGLDPTDALALQGASPAIAGHAIRRWLRACSDQRHPPDAAAVGRVLAVARGAAKATEIGDGWRVERHHQRLVLVPPPDTLG
jgi:tRNA(Ile)-lysidine synthase